MSKLSKFYEIFHNFGYIHEADYDRIFTENPEINNSPTRPGMQLNDMVMNRQRCALLGKNFLRQHQLMRQEIVNESTPRRKQPKN